MAENLKGFTIELSLDSLQVDSGLRSVKQSMKLMDSELKNNMSAFGRGEKSMEKYGVQLSGLEKKHEAQAKVVENAQARYDDLSTSTTASTKKVEKAATELNNAQAQYNNLGRHIEGVTSEMNQFERTSNIQATTLYKTGNALEGFGNGLGQVSDKAKQVGGSLTKKITVPALAVAGAVGGMVASFGWGRLVGVDNAQAQLKGLGYSTKEIGSITEQVTSAIEGGMTTVAEGTAIAAGGLAAGVKEGAELEKYIQLVGDAAVGANRPVDEMAQIFNRVQGSGKLMTQELNMIEQGMPGFAQAIAKHLNVSTDELDKMVTAGEVSSDDFLEVMDDFAGGMAEAQSETWQGMLKNTKAYLGILGESLLDGVFVKSKESIAEFVEMLKSDEIQERAVEFGEKINLMFTGVVDKVKGVVKWFTELSSGQQRLIASLAGFAVAIGPLLLGLGTLGGIIGKVSSGLGTFFKVLAPLTIPIKAVGGAIASTAGSTGFLGTALAVLSNPVTIAIAIIAGLAAGFTIAYKKSETFRNFIQMLGEKIREIFAGIREWIQPGIDAVVGFFGQMKEKVQDFIQGEGAQLTKAFRNIKDVTMVVFGAVGKFVASSFGKIKSVISFVMPFVEGIIKMVWGNIKGIITGALDVIMGAVKIFSGLFTGDFSKMWEGVKQMFSGAIKVIWNWIQLQFIGKIMKGVGGLVKGFSGHIKTLWLFVKNSFTKGITKVVSSVKNSFVGKIITAIVNFVKTFKNRISVMWASIKHKFSTMIVNIVQNVKNSFVGKIIKSIVNFVKTFKSRISNMWRGIKSTFSSFIKNIRTSIANSFVGRMIKSVTTLKTKFVSLAGDMWKGVKSKFTNIVDGAKALPGKIGNGIRKGKNKAISGMKSVGNGIISAFQLPIDGVKGGINWVLGKFGVDKIKGSWKIPKFEHGTGGHKGGPAVVNLYSHTIEKSVA